MIYTYITVSVIGDAHQKRLNGYANQRTGKNATRYSGMEYNFFEVRKMVKIKDENKPGYKPVKCSLCNGTGTIDSETMDSLTENIPMEERE